MGDLFSSVGVIIASIIIYFYPDATIADPICTYLFSIFVFYQGIPIIRDCLHTLMEGAPGDYNIEKVEKALKKVKGVEEVHDVHIWSISNGIHSLSAHIRSNTPLESLKKSTEML